MVWWTRKRVWVVQMMLVVEKQRPLMGAREEHRTVWEAVPAVRNELEVLRSSMLVGQARL